ncbi:acyl transferase/acyl hydrolase/lysophospholipase [Paraphoma chrysanthemicola]|uniref:Patatin-like phospholipase domain-containing protein n=1 Tax=Paraphoma chrysanthemicola TaxID=798071 RepID=A0A8K0VVM0_9PLEO|nr:acyl transferase/acyl hydrolase/lysophospholipase [Paraphoma chrysanthemicola]
MSLLTDTLFSGGSTRLHVKDTQRQGRALRKSKSYGGFLTPLAQLVRDPVGTLHNAVGNQCGVPGSDAAGAYADRIAVLQLRIRNAETIDEWNAAATELDAVVGNNPWKEEDDSPEYDAAGIAARLREWEDACLNHDLLRILHLLRTDLSREVGGIGDKQLYKHSFIGTKKQIERYLDVVVKAVSLVLDISEKQGSACPLPAQRILEQIKIVRATFGRTAVLLSGGGTFGMNHIGVIKALWDAKVLPRIVSGASAGSIVAAVLCTKTDAEIPEVMHEFCYGDLDVFEKLGENEGYISKVVRMFTTGGAFDISHLMRVMKGIFGNMTFKEAYNRTQRVLNIPVSTSTHFELPRLLNHVTAPNVIIWSAVCTSCSVPLVFKKASLLAKDPKTREIVPWDPNPEVTWIDGSVDNDLPMTRLSEMFNVNHFIVSQVNPHVVPFLTKDGKMVTAEESRQPPALPVASSWLKEGLNLASGELVHRMQVLVDMGVFPSLVTKLTSVLSQRYYGDINIFPQISMVDFPRVLSNPTPEYMIGCMQAGQRATWPKLSRINNHVCIELALDKAVHELEARVISLNRQPHATTSRPASAGNDLAHHQRSRSSQHMESSQVDFKPVSPVLRKSAPTSPLLTRASLHFTLQNSVPPATSSMKRPGAGEAKNNRTIAFQILSPTTGEEDSSERDYYAEAESDTTNDQLSPSPTTSPSNYGTASWSSPYSVPLLSNPQPHKPSPSATTHVAPIPPERRNDILESLRMTPATEAKPSSQELQYRKLFHPRDSLEQLVPSSSAQSSSGARADDANFHAPTFALNPSGAKGFLSRRTSSNKDAPGQTKRK